jgi:hypothetical protein
MSIEQTNQLILLILNSALMMILSAALLGGAWLRQNMLFEQLHQIRRRYQLMTQNQETKIRADATVAPGKTSPNQASLQSSLKKIRSDRQRLSQQYRWSHIGMLTLHMGLLLFSVSLLALALRSLLSFDGLISTALLLFTLGAAGLLAGTGCMLVGLWQSNSWTAKLDDGGPPKSPTHHGLHIMAPHILSRSLKSVPIEPNEAAEI